MKAGEQAMNVMASNEQPPSQAVVPNLDLLITEPTDIILNIYPKYMAQIVNKSKTYEFRRYLLPLSVKRVWFYTTAPASTMAYICEIGPGKTRNTGDEPLPENGIGNVEFNSKHEDWASYDYAYEILSVWKMWHPLSLEALETSYGFRGQPKGKTMVPEKMSETIWWNMQLRLK